MKQVSTTKSSSVLSSPLYRSIYQRSLFSRYRFVLLLAVIVLFVSSCHKEDQFCKKTVPFIAVFQVNAVVTQVGPPQIVNVTGTGDGTPIGKSTIVGYAKYAAPAYNFTGGGTITSENGDQIFVTGIEGPGPNVDTTTGNILSVYRAKITGGTGRFAGATGIYTDVAHASTLSPAGIDSLKGTITLDDCHEIDGRFKN